MRSEVYRGKGVAQLSFFFNRSLFLRARWIFFWREVLRKRALVNINCAAEQRVLRAACQRCGIFRSFPPAAPYVPRNFSILLSDHPVRIRHGGIHPVQVAST